MSSSDPTPQGDSRRDVSPAAKVAEYESASTQKTTARILHLDDSPDDAELIKALLQANGHHLLGSVHSVHTKEAYLEALRSGQFDVILSDHLMSGYDGDEALGDARALCPDVPFIMVTGELGEEQAIETLKRGAADYVLKDHLARLIPAIERALKDAAFSLTLREKEALLARSRYELEAVVSGVSEGLIMLTMQGDVLRLNKAAFRLLGFSGGAVQPQTLPEYSEIFSVSYPDGRPMPFEEWPAARVLRGEPLRDFMTRVRRLDTGVERTVRFNGSIIRDESGAPMLAVLTLMDVTEQMRAQLALEESERHFRILADSVPLMIWATDPVGVITLVNKAFEEFFGVSEREVHAPGGWEPLIHPDDREAYMQVFRNAIGEQKMYETEMRMRHRSGEWRWIRSHASPRFSPSGAFLGMVGNGDDLTREKRLEDALKKSLQNLRMMVQYAVEPMVLLDQEGVIEAVNRALLSLLGYGEADLVGQRAQELVAPMSRLESEMRLRDLREHPLKPAVASFQVKTREGSLAWMTVEASLTSLPGVEEHYLLKLQKLDFHTPPTMQRRGPT